MKNIFLNAKLIALISIVSFGISTSRAQSTETKVKFGKARFTYGLGKWDKEEKQASYDEMLAGMKDNCDGTLSNPELALVEGKMRKYVALCFSGKPQQKLPPMKWMRIVLEDKNDPKESELVERCQRSQGSMVHFGRYSNVSARDAMGTRYDVLMGACLYE